MVSGGRDIHEKGKTTKVKLRKEERKNLNHEKYF
jgi:hypothetical protein